MIDSTATNPPLGAAPTVAPTREFSVVWLCYGLSAAGLLFFWPTTIALIISYVKRGATRGTILESHHTWLIRTIWIGSAGFALALLLVVAGAYPLLTSILAQGMPLPEQVEQLNLNWGALAAAIGGAGLGLLVMIGFWFWTLYRLIAGGLRLNDGRATP